MPVGRLELGIFMKIEFGTPINVASPIPSLFYSAPCMLMGADTILSTIDTIVLALLGLERTSYEDDDEDEDQDGGDRELEGGGGGDQDHDHIAGGRGTPARFRR
jgi:hypothetical protein